MSGNILEQINKLTIIYLILVIFNLVNILSQLKKTVGEDAYRKYRYKIFKINRNIVTSFLSMGLGIAGLFCLLNYTNRYILNSFSLIFEHMASYLALLTMPLFFITQGANQFVINIIKVISTEPDRIREDREITK